ncbi:MAG: hypothetical protein JRN67_00170, partial [Nitrososphaerota archaeon]|nr:hypothetical protein [Nitrososphaerota archaeon]
MRSLTVFFVAALLVMGSAFVLLPSVAQSSPQPSVITGAQASTNGPLVDNLLYEMFLNTHSAYLAVKSGQANILDNVLDPADIADAQSSTNLNLNSTISYEYGYVAFNTQAWPTSDVHFRRAIVYLMNYPQIQSDVLQGIQGLATQSFMPQQLYGKYSTNNVTTYNFSLQSAMNELAQVGNLTHSNNQWMVSSTNQPLTVTLYTRAEFPQWQQVAQMIESNAASINLTINVQVVTHATAVSILTSHNFQIYTGGNIAGATPDYLYHYFYDYHVIGGVNNFMLFNNQTLDGYLKTILTSSDPAQVQQATYDAQSVLSQQIPLVPWYFAAWIIPSLNTGWTGYVFQPGFSTWKEGQHIVDWTVLNAHQTNSSTGGTFKVALISPPDTLNPVTAYFNYDTDVLNVIYDPALAIGPVNETQLIPWLVSSYTLSPFSGSTPHGESVPNGQTLTMNFVQNATFQDNTKLTALDYNFSIWYETYAGPKGPYAANAPFSPTSGTLPGLVDSRVNPSNPYQVTLYLNDTSLFDVYNAGTVWVLPRHIWQNINSTELKSYDPTAAGTEIGSGPFVFQSWVKGSTISLTRNLGYFRTPWWEYSTPVTPSSNSFTTTITQGSTPISNATVVLQIGNSSTPVETVTLTGGSNGVYTGSIPTSQLQNAMYEATVNATYTAGGTQHEALRFSAVSVSGVTTTTNQIP